MVVRVEPCGGTAEVYEISRRAGLRTIYLWTVLLRSNKPTRTPFSKITAFFKIVF